METADLFAECDNPDYWDEGDWDRRDYLGVIISYEDVKTLAELIPEDMAKKLIRKFDRWGWEVASVL